MEISKDEFLAKAKEYYGDDNGKWEFRCSSCKRVQSFNSIVDQMKSGIGSKRHGILTKGDDVHPESECYSPECNWVAYGLFNSGILVIHDPTQEHNKNRMKNCCYVFPFSKDPVE